MEGKYTLEIYAKELGIKKQSALNRLSRLKKKGFVKVSSRGGKRIYTLTKLPKKQTKGFYDIVNKYAPEKLTPKFQHYTHGEYTVENAIIDGIKISDVRTKNAIMRLFRHVSNWKRLFDLAKENKVKKQLIELYKDARKKTRCKRMPKRCLK